MREWVRRVLRKPNGQAPPIPDEQAARAELEQKVTRQLTELIEYLDRAKTETKRGAQTQ